MTTNQTMEKLGEGLRMAWEEDQKMAKHTGQDTAQNSTENGEESK